MKLWTLSMALVLAAATPTLASHDRALVISDVGGDANFVNDGGEFTTGNTATPTSQPRLDLRQVTLRPIFEADTTTGLAVTYRLQAPLADRVQLTLKARTPTCPDILLRYVHGPRASGVLSSGCSRDVVRIPAVARGNTLTLNVPLQALPAKARRDNVLTTVNAFSQVHLVTGPGQRTFGSTMVDTTLRRATYALVR